MKFFSNYFSLKPYGNRLLEADAKQWIFSLAIVVYLMAFIEGIIWGSLAYFYFLYSSSSDWATLIAFTVGAVITITIWQIDASFVRYEFNYSIFSKQAWKDHRDEVYKIILSVLGRILIIVFSSMITAQNVSKLIYIEDVKKAIADNNYIERAKIYNDVMINYDDTINSATRRYHAHLDSLLQEVAGKGTSGRHGDAIVANVWRKITIDDSLQIVKIQKEKSDTSSAILKAKDEELKKIFPNFNYKRLTPKTISEEINTIEKTKDSFLTWLTRGFIWFLFILLILVKLLQGKSLSYYLNSELQGKYLDLLNDRIDDSYLVGWKVNLKKNPENISVFDFHDWYYEWFVPRHENLKKDEELQILTKNLDKLTQQINELVIDAKMYTENVKSKFDEKLETEDKILQTTDEKITIEESIKKLNITMGSLKSLDIADLNVNQIKQITSRIGDSENTLYELSNTLKLKIRELTLSNMIKDVMEKDYEALLRLNEQLNGFLEKLQVLKLELRQKFVENIGNHKTL